MDPPEILYVEDNPADLHLVQEVARIDGLPCTIHGAASYAEAMDFLEERAADPERLPLFVLLDLNLSGDDGIDVLRAIRARDELVILPVVVYSSSRAPGDLRRAYAAGASGFLLKRLDIDPLAARLRALVEYWALMADDVRGR